MDRKRLFSFKYLSIFLYNTARCENFTTSAHKRTSVSSRATDRVFGFRSALVYANAYIHSLALKHFSLRLAAQPSTKITQS